MNKKDGNNIDSSEKKNDDDVFFEGDADDTIYNKKPADDPEVTDTVGEEIERLANKCMPYKRYIMIIGFTLLILLVVFLGFAVGGLKVCEDLDGVLDADFKCHPNYKPNETKVLPSGQPFDLQINLTIQDVPA